MSLQYYLSHRKIWLTGLLLKKEDNFSWHVLELDRSYTCIQREYGIGVRDLHKEYGMGRCSIGMYPTDRLTAQGIRGGEVILTLPCWLSSTHDEIFSIAGILGDLDLADLWNSGMLVDSSAIQGKQWTQGGIRNWLNMSLNPYKTGHGYQRRKSCRVDDLPNLSNH